MVYKVIGVMCGSSLDGVDLVFAALEENAGKWHFDILNTACYSYDDQVSLQLQNSTTLSASAYLRLHTDFGNFLGQKISKFITENKIEHQVHFAGCHGHTTFHFPEFHFSHQLGEGSAIAARIGLPVITDLRSMDMSFGGQGAPIVPIGEKLLFPEYEVFLNLGGIANISFKSNEKIIGFDICPANKVLNMLASDAGFLFDRGGEIASRGMVNKMLLEELDQMDYYKLKPPKSLANSFGIEVLYPLIKSAAVSSEDALCTYVSHIVRQVSKSIDDNLNIKEDKIKLFVTGGGAFNDYLISCLRSELTSKNIELILPSEHIINFKEALVVALFATLRWREQYNVVHTVTGALRDSIGGALWLGGEA